MEPLQHGPRTKQQIKDALFDFLYTPIQQAFKNRLDTLIFRNTVMGGYGHKSFMYKGVFYNIDPAPPALKKNRLMPQLRTVMDEYIKELNELNEKELPYVLGFINQVLNSSDDLEDYLLLLPESVHHPVQQTISSCPCRHSKLTSDRILQIQAQNVESISLMKKRQVMNLII